MRLSIEFDREADGRWIATVPEIPGVSCCGGTQSEALAAVKSLALVTIADRIEHGELPVELASVTFEPGSVAA